MHFIGQAFRAKKARERGHEDQEREQRRQDRQGDVARNGPTVIAGCRRSIPGPWRWRRAESRLSGLIARSVQGAFTETNSVRLCGRDVDGKWSDVATRQ